MTQFLTYHFDSKPEPLGVSIPSLAEFFKVVFT